MWAAWASGDPMALEDGYLQARHPGTEGPVCEDEAPGTGGPEWSAGGTGPCLGAGGLVGLSQTLG